MAALYDRRRGVRKGRAGGRSLRAIVEPTGMLIRAEALAGGRNVRNKGVGPARRRVCRGARASPTKTLWDD